VKTVEIVSGFRAPLLTVADMMEIGEAAWDDERKALLADLEVAGASAEQRLAALREQSLRKGTALVLLIATMRLDVASDVIRRAAFRAKQDPDEILARLTPAEIVERAQKLCGYERSDEGNAQGPAATA
jgi:hypothetical protein